MAEKPDYEKIASIEEVEKLEQQHKDRIVRKVKERGQLKQNRKEAMAGYNEQLKEVEFELDHNTEILDELARHKKLLLAKAGASGPVASTLKSV